MLAQFCLYSTLLVSPGNSKHPSQYKWVETPQPVTKPFHFNGQIWRVAYADPTPKCKV